PTRPPSPTLAEATSRWSTLVALWVHLEEEEAVVADHAEADGLVGAPGGEVVVAREEDGPPYAGRRYGDERARDHGTSVPATSTLRGREDAADLHDVRESRVEAGKSERRFIVLEQRRRPFRVLALDVGARLGPERVVIGG